ncbi:MAG: hypothetical protein GHCLOJNM_04236 [bacterium]|nr:hypothetical protein [bacterium]
MDYRLKELPRKDWLLVLWDYHHGHLPPEKHQAVEELTRSDLDARTDSERVLEIINELRQIGRWDPSPEFQLEALDRLIRAGEPSRLPKILVAAVALVILLVALYFLFRGEEVESKLVPLTPSPETISLFSPPADTSIHLRRPERAEPALPRWVESTTLELRDPVANIETEVDNRFPGVLNPSP